MKIKILKEAADDTMPLNREKRLSPQNVVRSARHQFQAQPVKKPDPAWDPKDQENYLRRHGLNSRVVADAAQKEAKRPDFASKMSAALQKDPTAADRIQDAMQTRELKQDVGRALLKIVKGGGKAPGWTEEGGAWDQATVQILQSYTYILALEYSLIHAYRWYPVAAPWLDLPTFLDAWLGKYSTNPVSDSPKAYARRHKSDMKRAQERGDIKDFDPENILYALRENKQTIKCRIRRKK